MDVSRVFFTIAIVICYSTSRSIGVKSSGLAQGLWKKPVLNIEVVSVPSELGEGPHWDETTQQLYFVDIFGQAVHRYDPKWKNTTTVYLDEIVSIVIPIKHEKNKFIITLGTKVAVMTWDGESRKPTALDILTNVGDPTDGSRMNDGKADAFGRLWAGTASPKISITEYVPEQGVLFKLTERLTAEIKVDRITVSNGMAWSSDNRKMYYTDSLTRNISVFDYDLKRGEIKNRRTAFDFVSNGVEGLPDGMTIDAEDKLWIACFQGARVIRVDPTIGKVIQTVRLPSYQITSVTFGGPNLDELYVTSGNTELTPAQVAKYPYPGYTFRIRGLGIRGTRGRKVNL